LVVVTKLAACYTVQERLTEAEPHLWRALELRRRLQGPNHPKVAKALDTLAHVYRKQRKFARAEPLFKFSLAAFEQALGSEHPHVADRLEHYASILRTLRRNQDAELFEARARAIRAKRSITL
jgi:biopolymer transport protein ExbB/TolQ